MISVDDYLEGERLSEIGVRRFGEFTLRSIGLALKVEELYLA